MAEVPSEIIELIKDFVMIIKKNDIQIEKVILFGSYAKGNYHKDSDIDLAIISPSFREDEYIKNMSRLLLLAAEIKADIQTIPFSVEEYNNPEGFIEEILKTGIELKVA